MKDIHLLNPREWTRLEHFMHAWQHIMCITGNVKAADQWWAAADSLTRNDIGPPKEPDGLEDVEGVQGGERQIDSHEPG